MRIIRNRRIQSVETMQNFLMLRRTVLCSKELTNYKLDIWHMPFEAVNHWILAKCIKVRWLLHMSVVLTMFRDETISNLVKHIMHTSIGCRLERNNYCKCVCGRASAQTPRYTVTERSVWTGSLVQYYLLLYCNITYKM
jgi:hypothetical protein